MEQRPINVMSEIGKLRAVLLCRPGAELENLTPDTLQELLFDDIPYLKVAQEEHDRFANLLKERGAEVLYYDALTAEALADESVREHFVDDMLRSSKQSDRRVSSALRDYLLSMDTHSMVRQIMAGVRKKDIKIAFENSTSLEAMVECGGEKFCESGYPFYLDPMPNLYFSRDYAAAIGHGMTINHMHFPARRRESLFMKYILEHHPRFKDQDVPIWYDRDQRWSIEGGDEQVWNRETVTIGLSQRTQPGAIEQMATKLLAESDFKRVVALEIPKSHALMHLDTVLTVVDYNKFTIFPSIMDKLGEMNIFVLSRRDDGEINIEYRENLMDVIREVMGRDDIDLIPTGGGDQIASEREQWNDGSNTLAIAPGVVVTYDRNYVSNQLMREHGLEVLEIPGAELGRGRGGPRCMSMPLVREEI
ncbi:arginine deiminase [Candidatus Saccharibacteria bacterium]|nr:arginine deiminase [Candidatus Saccharibacteria bacterium]